MKKILFIVLLVTGIMLTSCNPDCAHKFLTHHTAVASTCTEHGTIEYWECDACHVKFADSQATFEIGNTEAALDPNNHDMTYHAIKAATCTDTGVKAYYECNDCHNKYSDEAGSTLLTDLSIPVNPTAHYASAGRYITFTKYKASTCTTEGCVEHSHCSNCGKDFKTVGLTNVNLDNVTLSRHNINPATGCCTDCGKYVVNGFSKILDAIYDGKKNIALSCDIDWDKTYTYIDLDGITLDLCKCTLDAKGLDIGLYGDCVITNGTIYGNVIMKKSTNGFILKDITIKSAKDALVVYEPGIVFNLNIETKGHLGIAVTNGATLDLMGDTVIVANDYGLYIDKNSTANLPSGASLTISVITNTPTYVNPQGTFNKDPNSLCIF